MKTTKDWYVKMALYHDMISESLSLTFQLGLYSMTGPTTWAALTASLPACVGSCYTSLTSLHF